MTGPTIIYGESAQTRWKTLADGSLLVDVEGKPRVFRADPYGGFVFDHDSIADGILAGWIRDYTLDPDIRCYRSFRTGSVVWEVVRYYPKRDLYRCVPQGG